MINLLKDRISSIGFDDSQRKKKILIFLLTWTTFLALTGFSINLISYIQSLINKSHILGSGSSLLFMASVCVYFITLIFLAQKELTAFSSTLLSLTYLALSFYIFANWGMDVPEGLLMLSLTVIVTGILLGSRAGFMMTILIVILHSLFTHFQIIGVFRVNNYWKINDIEYSDSFISLITISIIALVSWLSNREIEASLKRAELSELALIAEKEQLEVRVKERTEELQKAQLEKMLHLYRFADLGKLAAGLMHDIVNPLTVVSINLEHLHDSARRKADMSTLQKAIARATDSTKRIEEYVEATRKQIQNQEVRTQFDIRDEIRHVLKIFSYRSRKERVDIRVKCPRKIHISGNPIKFSQCISNLLANALDAHISSSKDSKYIDVAVTQDKGHIVIRIKDNAIGIPPENLHTVFDAFYTTKDSQHGTGIGLAISKDIVEKTFHGEIEVTSRQGFYTTFTIKLPLPTS